ncbi:uncharacterized protein LOC133902001 [Phragmites australis]|uniref:uncharacterized protein LOC133902001 n=1 Tax=Phragmites australis TaxID=29695 RepID=UPI002D793300|nr:uncharacterized protein LOC133902001 [Phragmites australis]
MGIRKTLCTQDQTIVRCFNFRKKGISSIIPEKMASLKRGGGRSPFKDLTNTPNTAGDNNSNVGGSMASSKRGGGRSPFKDLTNTPNTAGDNNNNVGGSMASSKRGGGRSPFKDLTNTPNTSGDNNSNVGGSMTSDTQPPLVDARERKRQRDRDRTIKWDQGNPRFPN